MGTPDTIIFRCPECNTEIWEQYKPGICETHEFDKLPEHMWEMANGTWLHCQNCNKRYVVECPVTKVYGTKGLRVMSDAEAAVIADREEEERAYWESTRKEREEVLNRIRNGDPCIACGHYENVHNQYACEEGRPTQQCMCLKYQGGTEE